MKLVFLCLAFAMVGSIASAKDLKGTCLLVVDGTTYLESTHCSISLEEDGSFSIGTDRTNEYFAYAIKEEGLMYGYWNGKDGASHADHQLGELRQEQITRPNGTIEKGGCWVNDIAKVCAWK